MERVLIIGNAGSGKTTFSRQLAAKYALPLVHLDKIYWCGNWEHLSRDAFDKRLQEELEKPRWIIDGNFNRTLPHRLQYCDTVFYFDFPAVTCLAGITKRILTNYGKTRADMGGSCTEYFDKQKITLYRNVLTFNKQHRKDYCDLLSTAENKRIIIFKNRRQVHRFLKHIDK
ncbi:MAG: topology modulation protein [Oscillospiraceae bacterium]|nr:topology modulation protein [Oscillospiraceae bacterium]